MACVWIASCRLGRSQHANEHHAISMAIYGNLEIQEFEHNNRNGGVCVCVKLCTLENNTISEKIVMIGMIVAIIIIRSTFWRIPKCPGLTPSHFIPSSRHKAKAALPLSIASSIFLPSECANHFQQARVA